MILELTIAGLTLLGLREKKEEANIITDDEGKEHEMEAMAKSPPKPSQTIETFEFEVVKSSSVPTGGQPIDIEDEQSGGSQDMEPLLDHIKSNGGFTINPKDFSHYQGKGFAVGVGKENSMELKLPLDKVTPENLRTAIDMVYEKVSNINNAYIGGWVDEGILYIEPSKIYESFEEALKVGKSQNEIAIFSFETFDSIPIEYEEADKLIEAGLNDS